GHGERQGSEKHEKNLHMQRGLLAANKSVIKSQLLDPLNQTGYSCHDCSRPLPTFVFENFCRLAGTPPLIDTYDQGPDRVPWVGVASGVAGTPPVRAAARRPRRSISRRGPRVAGGKQLP